MNIYGRLLPNEVADSQRGLGSMFGDGSEPEALRATGTCDANPRAHDDGAQRRRRRSAQGVDSGCQESTSATRSGPGRTRTCDQGIMSPLL